MWGRKKANALAEENRKELVDVTQRLDKVEERVGVLADQLSVIRRDANGDEA